MNYLELCDIPIVNKSGASIPGFACCEGYDWQTLQSKGHLVVKKPTAEGRFFVINGPYAIPNNGRGNATRQMGAWVLRDPAADDLENPDEVGPLAGQWYVGRDGAGMIVIGDEQGSPEPTPGLPQSPSTERVRIVFSGGEAAPAAPGVDVGLAIAQIGSPLIQYNPGPPWSFVAPGRHPAGVIPLDESYRARLNDQGGQRVMPAINPVWPYTINGSTARPIVVVGSLLVWEEVESFHIRMPIYPVTLVKGTCGTVNGASIVTLSNLRFLWGRPLPASVTQINALNVHSWAGKDYGLAIQRPDDQWELLDLGCPA